ncbi:hypothetical protein [Chitinophaga sp. S165]|uniref:hypothetical protein n=1 Tax=Chitinophaga sp. S165 TaxID=2135462 RepID=UPI000D70DC48|nr:hypothetical protein [Chitinophaga sp. S165]PWV49120.1 hypothetical protein C7475_106366 [Chitinophaga sp. S165]
MPLTQKANTPIPSIVSPAANSHGAGISLPAVTNLHLMEQTAPLQRKFPSTQRATQQTPLTEVSQPFTLRKSDTGQTFPVQEKAAFRLQPVSVSTADTGAPVQRVRIKLTQDDAPLMDKLREVPVANAGAQVAENPNNLGSLAPIGASEDIIFEGHGTGYFGVSGQGWYKPSALADFANKVPKPEDWNGSIVLMGCQTGAITESVSKEYFKLTNKTVRAIGTEKSIRVGHHADQSRFIGSDWEEYPESQRPQDLAFVRAIQQVYEEFHAAALQLLGIIDAFNDTYLPMDPKAAQDDIGQKVKDLDAKAERLVTIDEDYPESKRAGVSYKEHERAQMVAYFTDVSLMLQDGEAAFRSQKKSSAASSNSYDNVVLKSLLADMKKLEAANGNIWPDVSMYLQGLTLKEVDLSDPRQSVHASMRRTATSFWGDTWKDMEKESKVIHL